MCRLNGRLYGLQTGFRHLMRVHLIVVGASLNDTTFFNVTRSSGSRGSPRIACNTVHWMTSLCRLQEKKDYFISYNDNDRVWAEWIAWQLENEGFSTIIQAWDFRPGGNFVLEMQEAAAITERTIAILSSSYLAAEFTQSEWAAAFAADPKGARGSLIPVLIEDCSREGILAQIIYIDLRLCATESDARRALFSSLNRQRAKPLAPPDPFRTKSVVGQAKPDFPLRFPAIWNVPYHRNPAFTGRETHLREVRQSLHANQKTSIVQSITGLGGIGKTHLALEYTFRHCSDYDVVWWLRSERPDVLLSDFIQFASAAHLPEADGADLTAMARGVSRWFNQNDNWLLVFDNVEKPNDIVDYVPTTLRGHVLVTSRFTDWSRFGTTITVERFTCKEAIDYIVMSGATQDRNKAGNLAEHLGYLPLALEQAAAFIRSSKLDVSEYLDLFERSRQALWDRPRDERTQRRSRPGARPQRSRHPARGLSSIQTGHRTRSQGRADRRLRIHRWG